MPDTKVRDRIIAAMRASGKPMAEQDFGYMGTNSSGVTRELRRMQFDKLVTGKRRYDPLNGVLKKYKEWELVKNVVELPEQERKPEQQDLF